MKADINKMEPKYTDREMLKKIFTGMSWLESHLHDINQTMVSDTEISFEQFFILYSLAHSPKHRFTVKELATNLFVSSSAVSRKLTYLLQNDLLVLNSDSHDRRYRYLAITSKGEKIIHLIEKINEERFSKFLDEFGRSQTADLTDELYKAMIVFEKLRVK